MMMEIMKLETKDMHSSINNLGPNSFLNFCKVSWASMLLHECSTYNL